MALLLPSPEIPTFSGCRHSELPATIFPYPKLKSDPRNLKTLTVLKKNEKFCFGAMARLSVYSRIKKCEAMISDIEQNVRCKEEEEKQNYYVNVGYAIRTLREEFPELFYRELSFDIYRDDIVLKDPLNTFTGIETYKSIFWALRFHGRIFFKALWVDIISVWQPSENIIMVRWTVHGVLRVPWESHGRFDGTSEYKLDKNGKIFEHRVDNIAFNSPPKFQVLAVGDLIQSLGCPSTPRPTYFEVSLYSERT